jgi:hypothetical protein
VHKTRPFVRHIRVSAGLPHEAHAAASLGIVLDAVATGNIIDDRPKAGAAGKLLAEHTVAKNDIPA